MKEHFTEHEAPISYICSPLFEKHGVKHMFTRRRGGVSMGCYESLNFAVGAGSRPDGAENVLENHRRAASVFGLRAEDICRTNQLHTANVLAVDGACRGTGLTRPPFKQGTDGLVCAEEGVLLSVRGADCVTVLLYDTKRRICGACHSGWRGTAAGISANAVREMRRLGAESADIIAAIGPSARSCCYCVNEEVRGRFLAADGGFAACFERRDGVLYLDLQRAVALTLLKSGVKEENISDCGECTVCGEAHYFSHRRSGADRGTMAAFITV